MKLYLGIICLSLALVISTVIKVKTELAEPSTKLQEQSKVIRPGVASQVPTEQASSRPQIDPIQPKQTTQAESEPFFRTKKMLADLDIDRRKSEADYFVEMAKADPNFRETIHLHYRLNGQSGEAFPSLKGIPQLNGTVSYNFKFISAGSNPRAADGSLVSMEVEVTITGNHVLIKRGRNVMFDGTGILIDGIQGSVEDEFIGVVRFEGGGIHLEWNVS